MRLRSSQALELEATVRRKVHLPVMDGAEHARKGKGTIKAAGHLDCTITLGRPKAECIT